MQNNFSTNFHHTNQDSISYTYNCYKKSFMYLIHKRTSIINMYLYMLMMTCSLNIIFYLMSKFGIINHLHVAQLFTNIGAFLCGICQLFFIDKYSRKQIYKIYYQLVNLEEWNPKEIKSNYFKNFNLRKENLKIVIARSLYFTPIFIMILFNACMYYYGV